MRPTPGGGPSLLRLAVVNSCALGFGLTDGVFFHFMIQTLMKAGASNLLAFTSLAAGGLLAMIFAPMASAGSTSPNRRAQITFFMLLTGALCCASIGMVFATFMESSFVNVPMWKAYIAIALAALYRACVQASPVVPCIMDAALTRGDEVNYPQRRDISLSFFYMEYRIGFVISSLAVALLPNKMLADTFPVMVSAASISLVLTSIATLSFPYEYKKAPEETLEDRLPQKPPNIKLPKKLTDNTLTTIRADIKLTTKPVAWNDSMSEVTSDSEGSTVYTFESFDDVKETKLKLKPNGEVLPPFKERVVEHMNAALFQADRRLLAGYVELLYYGIAFGQLNAITPCFFNDTVFQNEAGNLQGAKWASYVALTGIGLGVMFDASLPRMVFRPGAKKFTMTVAWSCGAFMGAALFFALIFVKTRWAAFFIFSALYLTTSTHNLFSLLCCGSLVEPKYRGTSFSVRAGAFNGGVLIGTLMSGFISGVDGWRWVMFHSSTACFASGLAAAFSGSVKKEDYAGVAANSNELWKYVLMKRVRSEEKEDFVGIAPNSSELWKQLKSASTKRLASNGKLFDS